VLAKDLVRDMAIQGLQFGATTHRGEIVTGLRRVEDAAGGHFVLETDGGDYPSRTIVIAAGIGAFEARRLGVEGETRSRRRASISRCIAVNNAVHHINPKAKVNPGHSSNLAIFGQKED
jgi:thioredoxin reductase